MDGAAAGLAPACTIPVPGLAGSCPDAGRVVGGSGGGVLAAWLEHPATASAVKTTSTVSKR